MPKRCVEIHPRLPHFHRSGLIQFITMRLHDAIPLWRLREILAQSTNEEGDVSILEAIQKIDDCLDEGLGQAWLGRPEISDCIQETLFHFDGLKYDLHAWVIMPNHILFCPYPGEDVSTIMRNWKGFSGRTANGLLRRTGKFWERNYFDKYIRDEPHYATTIGYIEDNPVKAGLCKSPTEWPWSSANYPRR